MQMDSQEMQRLATDPSGQEGVMVKQNASLPPAFQIRPQGPPSPRYPVNNGPGGPRLGGQQPPPLRRLDSRSSLGPGQRPLGPASLQGPRPQGFPQRAPQPQLFPGKNQGFPDPSAGPQRFLQGPSPGQRPQFPLGPRSLAPGLSPRPASNQQVPSGPASLQYNSIRPQTFQQRPPSQPGSQSESPNASRPGTPSSGRPPAVFSQRYIPSGPEGLSPQTSFDASQESRDESRVNNEQVNWRNNPSNRPNFERKSLPPSSINGKMDPDTKMTEDTSSVNQKPDVNKVAAIKSEMENASPKQKSIEDDDDDVVFDTANDTPSIDKTQIKSPLPQKPVDDAPRPPTPTKNGKTSDAPLPQPISLSQEPKSDAKDGKASEAPSPQLTSLLTELKNDTGNGKTSSAPSPQPTTLQQGIQNDISLPAKSPELFVVRDEHKPSVTPELGPRVEDSHSDTSSASRASNVSEASVPESPIPEKKATPTSASSARQSEINVQNLSTSETAKSPARVSSIDKEEAASKSELSDRQSDIEALSSSDKTKSPAQVSSESPASHPDSGKASPSPAKDSVPSTPSKHAVPRTPAKDAVPSSPATPTPTKQLEESPSRSSASPSPAKDSVIRSPTTPTPAKQLDESPANGPSPVPPKSLEATPDNSKSNSPRPGLRKTPSPLVAPESQGRFSVPGSPMSPLKSPDGSIKGFDNGKRRTLSPKSPLSTPQSPNPPKSPGCLRPSDGEKSGRSTPDAEGSKKRATFAKDLIMSGGNKEDESAASTLSDVKDFDLTTPEESSKGTPTTPSKGTPGTPKKILSPSSELARRPRTSKAKSPDKEPVTTRNRTARLPKDRSKASANRSKKPEGDNDSGVDESTQGHEPTTNGDAGSPTKSSSKIPGPKRSTASSPTKSPSKSAKSLPKTPDTAAASASAEKKKVPMNKIQVGAAPSPNLKTVRSKIGSLDNTSYKPGGGKVKIENRKLDFSKAQPKIAAKNDKYTPSGGDKKITQVKLQWNAKPKVGSLDNATYRPGGGDKKIETVKLDFKDKAKPKVGSKDNVKHIPGGGTVKSSATPPETPQDQAPDDIEVQKVEVKAESKVGSMDNMKHKPGGGDKKIFNDKDYLRQTSSNVESLSGSGSQEHQGNVVLNVISPSPMRKLKNLVEEEEASELESASANPHEESKPPSRPRSRADRTPDPPATTPVEEKKPFAQSRKSSLVKTPDRSKTPDFSKKVTIAETERVETPDKMKMPKTPDEKKPKTSENKKPKTPDDKKSTIPIEKKPRTPKSENVPKTSDNGNKPSTPRAGSPLKKSPSEERQKSPRKKSVSNEGSGEKVEEFMTHKKGKSPTSPRPPNSLTLKSSEKPSTDIMRKSSSKEFRLPKLASPVLPEISTHDPVIPVPGPESKIALPKLVEPPTPPSRAGMAQ